MVNIILLIIVGNWNKFLVVSLLFVNGVLEVLKFIVLVMICFMLFEELIF